MSRLSIRTFLAQASRSLEHAVRNKSHASFVIGNESADLDSIACALVYGYVQSSKPDARRANRYIIPITNIPAADLRLRPELTALLKYAELEPTDLLTLDDLGRIDDFLPAEKTSWTLVDHNALQGELGKVYGGRVVGAIDHHDDEKTVPTDAEPRLIEKTGSCSSHVANYCREAWDALSTNPQHDRNTPVDDTHPSACDAQVAHLALGAILIDTVNLEATDKVTSHDERAIANLEERIRSAGKGSGGNEPSYDRGTFFRDLDAAKSDLSALSLDDILRKDYKQWHEGSLGVGISSCVQPVAYLAEEKASGKGLLHDARAFARGRGVQLLALMTAHKGGGEGRAFGRELLLCVLEENGSAARRAAETFARSCAEELELEELDLPGPGHGEGKDSPSWVRYWKQNNLAASRKKVGPMLREAMKSA